MGNQGPGKIIRRTGLWIVSIYFQRLFGLHKRTFMIPRHEKIHHQVSMNQQPLGILTLVIGHPFRRHQRSGLLAGTEHFLFRDQRSGIQQQINAARIISGMVQDRTFFHII